MFNPFTWLREAAKQSVLGGVEDAIRKMEIDLPEKVHTLCKPAEPQGLADQTESRESSADASSTETVPDAVSMLPTQQGRRARR